MTDPSIPPAVIVPDPPSSTPLPTPGPNDPPPATPPTMGEVLDQLDAAKTKAADAYHLMENQRALTVSAEAHLHDAEVKLNERDAEIVVLRAELAEKVATVEVTCPTCGTRITG